MGRRLFLSELLTGHEPEGSTTDRADGHGSSRRPQVAPFIREIRVIRGGRFMGRFDDLRITGCDHEPERATTDFADGRGSIRRPPVNPSIRDIRVIRGGRFMESWRRGFVAEAVTIFEDNELERRT